MLLMLAGTFQGCDAFCTTQSRSPSFIMYESVIVISLYHKHHLVASLIQQARLLTCAHQHH